MAKILAVDDDAAILEMIRRILEKDGHTVVTQADASQLSLDGLGGYDLILLDIMMPQMDGFTLCEKIRGLVDCPILFLTAKTGENSLVEGLAMGADDYICKPFGVRELRARIAAHLRREHREHVVRMGLGRACFDLSAKQLFVDEQEVALTKGEYDICEFLAKHRGQIFSKEQILEKVFGYDSESCDSTITTHVKNIRKKLAERDFAPIHTVWGLGYQWKKEET